MEHFKHFDQQEVTNNHNKTTITKRKYGLATCYGDKIIDSKSNGVHRWIFKILNCKYGDIKIGIDEQNNYQSLNGDFTDKNGFGYCGEDGYQYHKGGGIKYGSAFRSNDIICMIFDGKRKELSFTKNGKSQGIAFKIQTKKQYTMAILMVHKQDSIKLESYEYCNSEQEAVGIYNKNDVEMKSPNKLGSKSQDENVLIIPTKILSHCLVLSICITDYKEAAGYRNGCDVDIKNINQTFGAKGFSYNIIQNKSKTVSETEYTMLINKARMEILTNGSKYSGFIFIFSGHGTSYPNNPYSSVILLSPEKGEKHTGKVSIDMVLDEFKNGVPGLGKAFLGKPRIYVIQACRGNDTAEPIEAKNDEQMDGDNKYIAKNKTYHPDDDMLLIQSNTAGYTSGRYKKKGSHLINAMCNVFNDKQFNNKYIALDDVVYAIKDRVKRLAKGKQACVSTTTLMHKILIKKK